MILTILLVWVSYKDDIIIHVSTMVSFCVHVMIFSSVCS